MALGSVSLGPRRKSIPLGDIMLGAVFTAARRPGGLHKAYLLSEIFQGGIYGIF